MIGSAVAGIPLTLVATSQGGKYPGAVPLTWLGVAVVYLAALVASQLHKPAAVSDTSL